MNNDRLNNNLFKLTDLCKPNNDNNTIVSGLSIKFALVMLLNGALGKSKEELELFLGKSTKELNDETLKALKENSESIKLANAFWFTEPNQINEEFKQIIQEYQHAEINIDDFNLPDTLDKINNWVSDNTNGLIKKVLNEISGYQSLLINTLYFKAQWFKPFNEFLTHDDVFKGLDNESNIQMMKTTSNEYIENEYVKGFSLRYLDSPYEFVAFLPNKEGKFNIEELDLNNLTLKRGNYDVNIEFPKLDIEFDTELQNALKLIGVTAPFMNSYDFTPMLSIPQNVSKIIHKVKFKLDEKGTEAAAATIIAMERCAILPFEEKVKINLIFNRPFAFVIRHIETNDLLFIGKINNL